ncbi:MAG: glycosyl hydrolase-related protein, partial [Anaerolineales bacterium]
QPYGLFHGGESNVRQRVYGSRTVRRLLGVWPRTFWIEEFDFFPQLPQMLRGVGYEYASLFFQWTWHTPEMPRETVPAIWWEGMDGSRLLTAPRTGLNLHQWPEDFEGLLESPLLREMPVPALVQWLELMPSPDWMCRSELMLPPLQALMAHPDFELRFATLSEYLEIAREHAAPRRHTLDDVFHGVSLGKNGDLFRRLSRRAEQSALAAESLSAMIGLFGRPYPSWDVYPAWELDEAWRELLSAQHHDNDECEGLCGHVGRFSYERSLSLTEHITARTLRHLADRAAGPEGWVVVYNPLGWSRDAFVQVPNFGHGLAKNIPPFGYRVVGESDLTPPDPEIEVGETPDSISLRRGAFKVTVERARGVIAQLYSAEFPEGALRADVPLADLEMTRGGQLDRFVEAHVAASGPSTIRVTRWSRDGASVLVVISLAPDLDAVDIRYIATDLPRPDPRMHAALQTRLAVNLPNARLIHDHPYGLSEIRAEGVYWRKYPSGDWMTSPQVLEKIRNPFTALQLLDFDDGERGLLYLHDGSQAFFRDGEVVRNILSMYDAWDEDYFVSSLNVNVRLIPHGRITNAQRWKLAQEFTRPVLTAQSNKPSGDLPTEFGPVWCDAPNVAVSAFYREMEQAGAYLERYAGSGMGYPYLLRLVELNGEAATMRVRLPGPVASAYRTNLLGEPIESLAISPAEAPVSGPTAWGQVEITLRPHEIATLYLDLAPGRKVTRDLDAHRHVWATVHRVST